MAINIVTFGVLHGTEPATTNPVRVDLTEALRNPADDPKMIELHRIERDDKWIDEVLVPNIEELAECLKEGRFPNGREL